MDNKKLISVIIGILLSVAGAIFGYNFKGEVCTPSPQIEPVKP